MDFLVRFSILIAIVFMSFDIYATDSVIFKISGNTIESVKITTNGERSYSVGVTLKSASSKEITALTASNVGKEFLLIYSDKVLIRTVIQDPVELEEITVDELSTREAAVAVMERILLDENGD